MKPLYKFFLVSASLLGFSACTDVVQIKLDEGSKLYVIDAFINNLRTDQNVRVVTSDSYFSTSEPPAVVGANVVLKDLSVNKSYAFNYTSNGYYTHSLLPGDTIAKANHQYQLEVTIDGFTYTSLIMQKRAAIVDSVQAEMVVGNGGFGPPSNDTSYFCSLAARDLVDPNTDYYWIKTYRNDTLFNAPSDLNICIDGTGGAIPVADRDTLDFSEPSILLGFKRYKKPFTCKVEVHSITRDTYFFFLQTLQQINNSGLFATTPENVKTNIVTPEDAKTKAVGWFSMSTVASTRKEVR